MGEPRLQPFDWRDCLLSTQKNKKINKQIMKLSMQNWEKQKNKQRAFHQLYAPQLRIRLHILRAVRYMSLWV